jgi:hypothetical protein
MDPYTLAYLAGHSDFSTTRRYIHSQAHTVRDAMERARKAHGGHKFGHSQERPADPPVGGTAGKETKWEDLRSTSLITQQIFSC